jgi:eukaryotic-like serine/threonine-protein kinase
MSQTVLGNRYTRGHLIGTGGMAEVYLAHDEVLDRDVALKVLKDKYVNNEEFVRRFRREARSAARLNHPNMVSVYDQGRSEDGTYYIAMEYIPDGTLKDRILAEGPLNPDVAVEFASQIAQALGHAHEHGVIHRDIKPGNILLTETGHAKVADFGIARAATATTTSPQSNLILGTLGYISPEQATGEPVDPRSDLYSLGVVFYEMLTGALPYSGESPVSKALKHVDEPPHSPQEANPQIPEPLKTITAKLLAKDPKDRYASAVKLAEDLERVRTGLSSPIVDMEKTTTEMVAAPFPSAGEKRPKSTILQPPAASLMKVFKGGRIREGSLFRTLATLLFGMILLGVLVWILMEDQGSLEMSNSEEMPAVEEATPSSAQEETPELYYASEAEGALSETGLRLGNRNETSNDRVPAGVVIEQDPAAGTMVDEGSTVDILVSTGSKQNTPAAQAPTSTGAGSPQASAAQAPVSTATGSKQSPAAVQVAPQSMLTDADASSRKAPTAPAASTAAQSTSASSFIYDTTERKKKEKR